jgi:hypothetical protein
VGAALLRLYVSKPTQKAAAMEANFESPFTAARSMIADQIRKTS